MSGRITGVTPDSSQINKSAANFPDFGLRVTPRVTLPVTLGVDNRPMDLELTRWFR
ncbi:MAG TPA: hypothetical protein VGQ62_00330 [Chloroflexota bacterium]|jgi:hypothetical protein|nr:hypothetical protein [Chloroflexota bacterium]